MQLEPERKKPSKQAEQVVVPLSFSAQVLQLLPQAVIELTNYNTEVFIATNF